MRCLVYDLETELRRRAAPEPAIAAAVELVRSETRPGARGGQALDWDSLIWRWRDQDARQCREIVSRAVWPAVSAELRRRRLRALEPDTTARHGPPGWATLAGCPRPPSPRAYPDRPSVSPATGTPVSAAEQLARGDPEWARILEALRRQGIDTGRTE